MLPERRNRVPSHLKSVLYGLALCHPHEGQAMPAVRLGIRRWLGAESLTIRSRRLASAGEFWAPAGRRKTPTAGDRVDAPAGSSASRRRAALGDEPFRSRLSP